MIDVCLAPNPALRECLRRHPEARFVGETENALMVWQGAETARRILDSEPSADVAGLIELMDNNPLVCASNASVPDAASTLALIAFGPAIRGGLMVDTPVLACSFEGGSDRVLEFLALEGWTEGCSIHCEPFDSGSVLAAKAMVEIDTTRELEDVLVLYDEAFGRSFFVRRDQSSKWSPSLVERTPYAFFRIEIDRDQRASLLKIQVIADRDGKCGAAQVIHMFNVMNGFEETLGIV